MPRRVNAGTGNGHSKIQGPPGIYEHLLVKTCTETATNPAAWLVASDNPSALSMFKQEQARRVAELIAQRKGKPIVGVQSHHLPSGLPEPFGQFPRGQRTFIVNPDDTITLRTMGAWQ
jgi:hypothetical protein